MKPFLVVLCLSVFTWMTSGPSYAEIKEITIASESWVHATQKDGTGLYWDILRTAFEPAGIKVNPLIRSYEGSVNLMEAKKVDAMVGAYADEIENGIYPKHYFAVDIVEAVGRKDSVLIWEGEKTVARKNVGWITGYAYDQYLTVDVNKKTFDLRKAAFRALDNGRIDFFLDARVDITDYLKSAKAKQNTYERQTILKLYLYFVFTKDKKGQKLADLFDLRFSKLVESGKIKSLYDYYYSEKKANFVYPY